jgi:NADP-dependent alcohol dehydrogenase
LSEKHAVTPATSLGGRPVLERRALNVRGHAIGGDAMQNFTYYNPTKIVFGRGMIAELPGLIPSGSRVLITYGGGSIKRNGVYDQVKKALAGYPVFEFGGIEPNPEYATCIKAVDLGRREKVDFLLAVGGGSVLDGTKFIAAAIRWKGPDAWDIVKHRPELDDAVPMGSVLTLPATGSEMNMISVMSRRETGTKRSFRSPLVYPRFSILDPETTYSLPERQLANGIADTFVHVVEQYLTWPQAAPLQDRQAEAVLLTLLEEAAKVRKDPRDYDVRANLMWCATHALNGQLGCGVATDLATHQIGHELTALYNLDHARTLAIVLPSLWRHQIARKRAKLAQLGRRVFGLSGDDVTVAGAAIRRTEDFFHSLGIGTTMKAHSIPAEAATLIPKRLDGQAFGEHQAIRSLDIAEILANAVG